MDWFFDLLPFVVLGLGIYGGGWASGFAFSEQRHLKERKYEMDQLRKLHNDHLDNIDKHFGVDSRSVPARIYLNYPMTEH